MLQEKIRNLADLQSGEHMCGLYSSEAERRALLVPLIDDALEHNRKVLYISGESGTGIRELLEQNGHKVDGLINSGRLALCSAESVYDPVHLDVQAVLKFIADQEKQAIAEGFEGVCGIDEMNWASESASLTDALLEYEGAISTAARGSRSVILCLYDQRRFDAQFLLHIAAHHTISIIGDRVYSGGKMIPLHQFFSADDKDGTPPAHLDIALFEDEPLYKALTEHAADGLFINDESGRILYANNCACNTLGYKREELLGKHLSDIEGTYTTELFTSVADRLKNNSPLTVEGMHRRKNGSLFPVELRITQFYKDGKRLYLSLARDITARKKAEKKLAKSESELKTVLENSPDVIVRIDRDLRYVYVNRTVAGSYNRREDIQGKTQAELDIPENIRKTWEKRLKAVFATAQPVDVEFAYPTENGERILQCKVVPEASDTGDVEHVLITTRDITELKATEKALRESERRYRRILEDHADLINRSLPDGTVTYANEACCRILQTSKENYIGANYLSFLPEAEQHRIRKLIANLTPEHPEAEIEHKVLLPSGEARYQRWINRGVFDENGNLVEVQGAGRDITERRRIEEELYLKQTAIDTSTNCISILDLDGRIIYVNKTAAEWWGEPQEELAGQDSATFFTSPEAARQAFDDLMKTGIWTGEQEAVRKDGSVFHILSSGHLVRDESGEPVCIMASAIDISERKRAEQELRIKDIAIDSSISATSFLGLNQELIYANKAAIDLWGYSSEDEVIGKDSSIFFSDAAAFERMFLRLVRDGHWRGELKGKRKDGSEFDVLIAGTLINGEHGEPLFVVGSCTDITEAKRAEKELRRTHEKLSLAHEELRKINEELEQRVHDRTAALSEANEVLKRHIEERRRAELALRKSEANYRLIFETAANMITKVNPNGIIISCNQRSEDILGYKASELVGQHVFEFIPPELHSFAQTSLEDVFKTGSGHTEIRLIKKDGTEIEANVNSSVLDLDSDEPINAICITEDITGRKRTEQALKESVKRYRQLVENQTGLLVKADNQGRLLFVSPSYCELFGKTQEELVGSEYMPLVHPDDQEATREAIEKLYHPPYSASVEQRAFTKYGWRWIAWSDQAILNADGQVESIVAAGRDITERRKAEEELRKSEAKYRQVVELSNDGICIVQDREAQYVNPQLKRILGYNEEDDLGRSLTKYIHPEAYPRQRQTYERLMSGEIEQERYESLLIHRDGHSINAEVSYGLTTYDGRPAVLGFIRDITEEKRAAEKLLDYQKQLQLLASELTLAEEHERRHIANDLHDRIGQTLAVAKMQLSVLRQNIDEPEIAASTDQVLHYLEQVMQDARLLTREISPPILYELGLEAAVQWLAELFEEQHGISAEFQDDGQPKPVSNDIRIVLFKAVRELLVNVAKHAQATKVTVAMSRKSNKIQLVVKDNGIGFDPKDIGPRLGQAGGFGLFNIHERLVLLGGDFSVESHPEKGTRVKLTAPVTDFNGDKHTDDDENPDRR